MLAACVMMSGRAPVRADDPPIETTSGPPSEPAPIEPREGGQASSPAEAIKPAELPELGEAAQALLEQPYWKPAERRELRVRHGVWEPEDLADTKLRAQAALSRGAYDDTSLSEPQADVLDRAEATLRMGEPERAIAELGDAMLPRALRIRGEAQIDLGRTDDAERTLQALAELVATQSELAADDAGEAARGLVLLARLRGAEGPHSVGYQDILAMLGTARDTKDRLSWRVQLAEALLLYEKDAYDQAGEALEAVLYLHPRCAEAWLLLGRLNVDSFQFVQAESIAARLDELAAPVGRESLPPPSLSGQIVRALIRLRQNEGAEALAQLQPLLARVPQHREVLALNAAATALSFDEAGTQQRLRELDAISPNTPMGYLAAGKAMALARQYADAAALLRTASERAPLWAEPLVELGLSELQAGNLAASRDALDKGLRLDRFHLRGKNSLVLLEEVATYASVESEHFLVRYKPGEGEVLAREMLVPLERIFLRVTGDKPGGIRHAPPGKTVIELYPNHRWFSTRITGMPQLHTFAAATGPVIAMELPKSGPGHMVGPYDWARVVQHEYTHTVTLSRTKNRLPHWFTEASAVFLEDAPLDYSSIQILARAVATDAMFDFDTINVMFVRPRRPTDRTQAYMQGAWMYQYIVERYGNDAPLTLMDLYASGVREPEAFQRVMGLTRERFLTDFTAWGTRQLEAWGMFPTEAHPAIETLLGKSGAPSPTPELIMQWREAHPTNPFVLELALQSTLAQRPAGITLEDVELVEDYARARPVDPLPHKLLAAFWLGGGGGGGEGGGAAGRGPEAAIPHLEFLDLREQNSPSFAVELAKRFAALSQWDEALAKITRATQIAPYDATVRELAATLCLQGGKLDEAERHLWALTLIEPDRPIHAQRLQAIRAKLGAAPPTR
jgi:cellulose synthase operon protein C